MTAPTKTQLRKYDALRERVEQATTAVFDSGEGLRFRDALRLSPVEVAERYRRAEAELYRFEQEMVSLGRGFFSPSLGFRWNPR